MNRKSAGAAVAALWRWWWGELRALLPRRVFPEREALVLELGGEQVVASVRAAGGRRELGAFALAEIESAGAFPRELRQERARRDLELVLPPGQVLAKTLDLPLAVEENLAQVIGFEMDRHTPFKVDAVYHAFRVLERRPAQGRLRIRLLVIPRPRLDAWLDRLAALDLRPDRVLAAGEKAIDLLPRGPRAQGSAAARANTWLARAVVVLLVAAALVPLGYLRQVVVVLNHEVSRYEGVARQVEELQARHGDLRQQAEFLVQRRLARPYTAEALDELARVLPDDTWVQSLELSGNRVDIGGLSESASGLIERIEASPMFESVSFSAPVTRDRMGGAADQFRITARIRRADG
ncbi:type II secretion system protein GspL [Thioalkalivibrio nitratireducens]|uniref:type II secretion system protein GspL n=1 Tax=Thioalkalivibrio nitratireducens TaxID=186931 RepID=UPI0012EED848|nr:type II secretion system protein GspL [Thioalkalivibrio nitratireducens]